MYASMHYVCTISTLYLHSKLRQQKLAAYITRPGSKDAYPPAKSKVHTQKGEEVETSIFYYHSSRLQYPGQGNPAAYVRAHVYVIFAFWAFISLHSGFWAFIFFDAVFFCPFFLTARPGGAGGRQPPANPQRKIQGLDPKDANM